MTPEALTRTLEDFLAGARDAVVLDEGAVLFDLAQARYSISGERNKCLLHLWSAERNVVRRVLDIEIKNEVLRLAVQRLGQTRPSQAGNLPAAGPAHSYSKAGRAAGLSAQLATDIAAPVP
jgi:hypothetical protein